MTILVMRETGGRFASFLNCISRSTKPSKSCSAASWMVGSSGLKVCRMTLPGWSARPARPATCEMSWNVLSAALKSGMLMAVSAEMMPTRVTFGKSNPLAIICVPMSICVLPSRKLSSCVS